MYDKRKVLINTRVHTFRLIDKWNNKLSFIVIPCHYFLLKLVITTELLEIPKAKEAKVRDEYNSCVYIYILFAAKTSLDLHIEMEC